LLQAALQANQPASGQDLIASDLKTVPGDQFYSSWQQGLQRLPERKVTLEVIALGQALKELRKADDISITKS